MYEESIFYNGGTDMFADRIEAGKELAKKLQHYSSDNTMVVALPRGGVAVAYPIATALHAPLEVIIVRKLGAPQNLELGIGAIAEDGVTVLDQEIVDTFEISEPTLQLLKARELMELERREQKYRNGKSLPLLTNKTVILVDDGLATGVSAKAAIKSLKKHHPKKIIFAVPVCSQDTARSIRSMVNAFIFLEMPERLDAIGKFYEDFHQMTDEEVMAYLGKIKEGHRVIKWGDGDFGHKIVW